MSEVWRDISQNLKNMLDSGTFKVWIAPLEGRVEGSALCLKAPSAYVRDWLESRLATSLREAAAPVLACAPEHVELRIQIPSPEKKERPAAATKLVRQALPQQGNLPLVIDTPLHSLRDDKAWRYSFNDFVVGPSNNVAVAAAQDVCRTDGCVQTLFINSASGLGKTHLAQAVGRQVSSLQANKVAYLTAEDFASRFVAAQRSRDVEGFKARLQGLDMLLLEDVHFFRNKEGMQNMALSVIKSLISRGGRLVCTSSFAPRDMQDMDQQLVSYLCSGILTSIERPTEDMRRDILQRRAKSFQVLLPDAVCDLLVSRLKGDIRLLESCLNSLIFKARLLNCGLNTDIAMEVLQQYAGADPCLDMPAIIRLICEGFGISERQLTSRSRRRECVSGRNAAFFLARRHTDLSLAEIGKFFNRRHSTVINGITAVENEMARESSIGRQYARVVDIIERNVGLTV